MNHHIRTDIVILGAGIGGYEAFRSLARQLKKENIQKKILIVDQNNYFTFVPMLHEVASGSILPLHATIPIRELTHKTNHQFLRATVQHIEPLTKQVKTSQGDISYDTCIIALGSNINFCDVPGAEQYAYHVRSLTAAMRLHHDVVDILEHSGSEPITITVVGGGFTGVEVAGQFCDYVMRDIEKLYPDKHVSIVLIHANSELLNAMPKRARQLVRRRLEKNGVNIMTDHSVAKVEKNKVILSNGTEVPSTIVIWTAGVKNVAASFLSNGWQKNGRIEVNQYLQQKKNASLYAIGDIALFCNKNSTSAVPQLGETAHKQGQYVAKHIVKSIKKGNIKPFSFYSKGWLMPIGDWYGIAVFGNMVFAGRFVWWLRRTVYVLFMPGIVRKLRIIFDWTMHSLSFRHIVHIENKHKE